jgi:hypothetical protein
MYLRQMVELADSLELRASGPMRRRAGSLPAALRIRFALPPP